MLVTVTASTAEVLPRCPLDPWQRCTERGDRAWARGDGHAAMVQYRAALSLADACFLAIHDAEAGTAALYVSHGRLAGVYEHLGQTDLHIAHACIVYEVFVQAMHDGSLAADWREATGRWGQRARGAVLALRDRYPSDGRLQRLTLH